MNPVAIRRRRGTYSLIELLDRCRPDAELRATVVVRELRTLAEHGLSERSALGVHEESAATQLG
jgi:hypothetical protein